MDGLSYHVIITDQYLGKVVNVHLKVFLVMVTITATTSAAIDSTHLASLQRTVDGWMEIRDADYHLFP